VRKGLDKKKKETKNKEEGGGQKWAECRFFSVQVSV